MAQHIWPLTILLAGSVAGPAFASGLFDDGYGPCGNGLSTPAVVACIQGKTQVADRRLNLAYAGLQCSVDAGQREPLRAAQRLWVRYRDANCRFYGAQDGTVSSVKAAECLHAMTDARAAELEDAAKP